VENAMTADYYADHAEEFLKDEILPADYTVFCLSTLGVVLAIMPLNFPFGRSSGMLHLH
jgi:acyl-CoA reductase-like NAD-dependent aldehyde dehydrogenase